MVAMLKMIAPAEVADEVQFKPDTLAQIIKYQ